MYIPAPTNFQFVSSHLLISQQHLSPRRDNVWCLATSPLPWLPLFLTHPNNGSPPPINSSPCHNMRNMFWLRDQNPNIKPTSLTPKNAQQSANPPTLAGCRTSPNLQFVSHFTCASKIQPFHRLSYLDVSQSYPPITISKVGLSVCSIRSIVTSIFDHLRSHAQCQSNGCQCLSHSHPSPSSSWVASTKPSPLNEHSSSSSPLCWERAFQGLSSKDGLLIPMKTKSSNVDFHERVNLIYICLSIEGFFSS